MKKIKLLHIINSFEFGGAEAMLCNLALRTDAARFETSIVSLIDNLAVAAPLKSACIPIAIMGMKPGIPNPLSFARLMGQLRKLRPDVIQTWMDHSNLIGGLAARIASSAPVVWGVHHSNHVAHLTKRSTLLTVGACAKLSRRLPARIVYCSQHARTLYAQRGFADDKAVFIPNGFDTSRFTPDPAARAQIRQELSLPPNTPLIGLVARHDPFKDHATFLRAASIIVQQRPDAHFLLCGTRVTRENTQLFSQIQNLKLVSNVHLLGQRRDVPRICAALDILASSSISEAFPLTVGEAMACAVPAVATNVGDSAFIIGDTGKIVPPSDPPAFAAATLQVLNMDAPSRAALGQAARQRVCELFDLDAVTRQYESLYQQLTAAPAPRDEVTILSLPRKTASAA